MILFVFFLAIVMISKSDFLPEGRFNLNYANKSQTSQINGIFVVMVLLGHYSGYVDMAGQLDEMYLIVFKHLGQLVVATFLFFSGFGIMESIKRERIDYVRKLPTKLLQLLFKFDCAVLLYCCLNAVLGYHYGIKSTLLALVAWSNIGNSNWYIFVILCIYILVFIAMEIALHLKIGEFSQDIVGATIFTVLVILFVYVLMCVGVGEWWYNTAILCPLGMWFSICKKQFDGIILRNSIAYSLALTAIAGVYIISYLKRTNGIEIYTVWATAFICLVLLISAKCELKSNLLNWCGNHVFSMYILQRIPMTIMFAYGFTHSHKYISLIVVITVTVCLTLIFETITNSAIKSVSQDKYRK